VEDFVLFLRGFCRVCFVMFFALSAVSLAKPHPGVSYVKLEVAGVPIHLVDADLSRSDLVLRPAVAPTGHRRDFGEMIARHRPVAAVNGTFFDTKTGITVGNLVSEGRLLSEGMTGSNLVFHRDGTVSLLSSSRNLGRYKDWSDVDFAVGGGPTLISDGQFFMDPGSEGFRDPGLFKPRPRSALGVTADGRLRMVVVTQGITLWQLAHVMNKLHCHQAINLDGGSSTGLSVGGTTMVKPTRELTNIIGLFVPHMQPRLDRAVQVAEHRAQGHFHKAQMLQSQGQLRKARSHFRQAVAKAPDQAGFWRAAGLVELEFGNLSRAALDLRRSAELYLNHGDLVTAQALAEKLLRLDANDLTAHLLAGECKVEQGIDDEAEIHLKRVLDSQPGHPRASELLKVLHYRQNA
jgi:phosphodiester glycosidase/tetratricopeptide repeat protein